MLQQQQQPSAVDVASKRATATAILTGLRAAGVQHLRVAFCTMSSRILSKAIALDNPRLKEKPETLFEGVGFVTCINGFPNYALMIAPETNLTPVGSDQLLPDFSTLTILPYAPKHAVVYGYLTEWQSAHQPTALCSRTYLRDQIAAAEAAGVFVSCGVELEFYLLEVSTDADAMVPGTNLAPAEVGSVAKNYCFAQNRGMNGRTGAFIEELVEVLNAQENSCTGVELSHREGGASQYEVVIRYSSDIMKVADSIVTARETLHALGDKYGVSVSLLPKLLPSALGNGLHLHFSVATSKGGANAFPAADPSPANHGISELGQAFMAGVLRRLDALVATTQASTNSYRRMAKGAWTGAAQAWAVDDKDVSVRACCPVGGVPEHFEVKVADATMVPHYALACIIQSGVDGVKDAIRLPPQHDPTAPMLPSTFGDALLAHKRWFVDGPGRRDAGRLHDVYRAVKEDECVHATRNYTIADEVAKFVTYY